MSVWSSYGEELDANEYKYVNVHDRERQYPAYPGESVFVDVASAPDYVPYLRFCVGDDMVLLTTAQAQRLALALKNTADWVGGEYKAVTPA